MQNTRESDPSPVGKLQANAGWLLVLMIAGGGLALAIVEFGLWLVFASGALAAFAIVALLRPWAPTRPTSLVQHAESGWGYLRTELARSRRHDRRFAVVGIPEEVWAPVDLAGDKRDEQGLDVATAIQSFIRRPDRAWLDGSRVHVLLTECDRQRGLAFLARARRAMPRVFGDDRVKLVVFPDDGITSGALLAALDPGKIEAIEAEPTGGVAR